jgi:hypothetical protein
MLQKHVNSTVLLDPLHHGLPFKTINEIRRFIMIRLQGRRTMLEYINNVHQVLIHKYRVISWHLCLIQLQVMQNIVQQMLWHFNVVFCKL